jgi:hypothetical protein
MASSRTPSTVSSLSFQQLAQRPGDRPLGCLAPGRFVAPNRGTWLRFMRIRTQVLTREGRELRDRLQRLD